ncbi:MAG: hypothetical protein IJF59_00450 [Clostridia bacterium]|nr:hypothetical protein [Clostridia bacterium]
MTIYIDNDYKCHVTDDGSMRPVETDFFHGKCDTFIEGYRLVPEGEIWTRSDGVVFAGEMVAPWKAFAELDAVQREYERQQMEDMQNALNELGVYQNG